MEKHKKHKKHRGGNGVGERNRTGKSSERSGHGAITASSAGSSSRYASGDKASNSFKKYAASIDETAAFLPSQNFDAALRAELAEAKALNLGSEAVRHATDMLALHGEVALSDGLVGRCEDALQRQHDLLAATRAQLVEADHINGELREEKLRAEQKAAELTLVLKTQLARQQALQAELDKTIGEMAEQGEVFRQAAAKIAAHREAEAKAFGERRRVWERTIDEWLKAGFQKRIDPLLHNVNQPVYTRLGELLVEEQAQREHQMEYLKLAQAHEVETLRGRFAERLAESDAQYAQLREHQHDFDSSLAAALTEYLRGELAAKTSKVASLEREIRLLHGELRDTRERHDQRDAERQIVSATALDPLRQTMSQLEKGVRSMAQEREQLAGADPRVLLDRQQKLLDEAQVTPRPPSLSSPTRSLPHPLPPPHLSLRPTSPSASPLPPPRLTSPPHLSLRLASPSAPALIRPTRRRTSASASGSRSSCAPREPRTRPPRPSWTSGAARSRPSRWSSARRSTIR